MKTIEYTVKVQYKDNGEIDCTNWYFNNKRHRENGPAIEHTSGLKYWYVDDVLHREDGPAIEEANGNKYWYINGINISEVDYYKRKNKLISCDGKVVEIDGKKYKLTAI